ncbi:MAG: peptidase M28, partial [Planctomycetaceae bacterium]|nr:peptidase M28 [Planctomycetaceae bacterium]
MHRFALVCLLLALLSATALPVFAQEQQPGDGEDIAVQDPVAAAEKEGLFLSRIRQLTFEGRRAGEGYFSATGREMVFQSEREPGNPFFQIYVMDLLTGDTEWVSPGTGKTTCAWIHPTERRVLFASTHEDPQAVQEQQDEIDLRNSGNERRYSWDYDEYFDIYDLDRSTGESRNLTHTKGY